MKFLTFLNSGCVEICKNMLKSAENVGLNMDDFIIACIDADAYKQMKIYKGAYLAFEHEIKEYKNWSFDDTSDFRKIVKYKWKIIKDNYEKHKELCFVDTDIVFLINPLPLIENSERILFQSDRPGSTICSGFMVFNSSIKCQKLIDICGSDTTDDDQLLINKIAISEEFGNDIALLNQTKFPNGYIYYQLKIRDNPIIVHNNFMVGIDEKIKKFKEENLWFI
jgi:hypothetical protein